MTEQASAQGTGALPYMGDFDGAINPDKWTDYMVMTCLAASTMDAPKFIRASLILQALLDEDVSQNTTFHEEMDAAQKKIRPDKFREDDDGQEKLDKEFLMAIARMSGLVKQIKHRKLIHIAYGIRPGEGAANHTDKSREEAENKNNGIETEDEGIIT